jgi:hypothetical protein
MKSELFQLFKRFNETYFRLKLPHIPVVIVEGQPGVHACLIGVREIQIASNIVEGKERLLSVEGVLLHEMCHLEDICRRLGVWRAFRGQAAKSSKTIGTYLSHGPSWQKRLKRLANLGAPLDPEDLRYAQMDCATYARQFREKVKKAKQAGTFSADGF